MLPVVVFGGYLGCGKTTAVNRLLADPGGRRLAVIVNDIGDVNIDAALIQAIDGDQVTLTNGCICCSLRDDLFNAVSTLVKAAAPIDAIVVEASGIADPVALVMSLKLLEDASLAHTETLVYLVDAAHFAELPFDDAEQVLDNAAACDLLVINKCDLAGDADLARLKRQLDDVGASDNRYFTEFAALPAGLLFAPPLADAVPASSAGSAPDRELLHHGFQQQTLVQGEPVERERFDAFLDRVGGCAWRIKGFVRFTDRPGQCFLYNQVGRRATLEPVASELADSLPPVSLVVIGRAERMPGDLAL